MYDNYFNCRNIFYNCEEKIDVNKFLTDLVLISLIEALSISIISGYIAMYLY